MRGGVRWLLLVGVSLVPLTAVAGGGMDGYLSAFSVRQGESIGLHVSITEADEFDVRIYRISVPTQWLASYEENTGTGYPEPNDAWEHGAQWPVALEIPIPEDWDSGIYRVVLSSELGAQFLYFVVREDEPGSESPILVLDNSTTSIAYNEWGGRSLYSRPRGTSLSLSRPGQNRVFKHERLFARWADHMGISVEHASMLDLHNDPELLSPYSTVVIVGHNEYWSLEMREHFDAFTQAGGNAVILGGNTMWWQIRIEGNSLICYKNGKIDPLFGVDDSQVTTYWHMNPVYGSEASSIGVSFANGGFVNHQNYLPATEGYGGYTVIDWGSDIYAGTGLKVGDQFGTSSTIVGYEVDGVALNASGLPEGDEDDPGYFTVLAASPAETGSWVGQGTMGMFRAGDGTGGYIFNAATVDWADGLWKEGDRVVPDPIVSKIMLNVLAMFEPSSGASCEFANAAGPDFDDDGHCDACDNCVMTPNPLQGDNGINNTGDACNQYCHGSG